MWHYVVVEIEHTYNGYSSSGEVAITQPCWNIVYKIPIYRDDLGEEESLCLKGCLSWIENNKAPGSKYAVMKMYLV